MNDGYALARARGRTGHGSWLGTLTGSSESLVDSPGQESARFTTRSNLCGPGVGLAESVRAEDVERDARAVRLVPETPLLRSDSTRRFGLGRRSLLPDGRAPRGMRRTDRKVPMSRAHVRRMWNWKRLSQRETHDSRLRGRWSRGMTALPG
jgi:hypothetical protein